MFLSSSVCTSTAFNATLLVLGFLITFGWRIGICLKAVEKDTFTVTAHMGSFWWASIMAGHNLFALAIEALLVSSVGLA